MICEDAQTGARRACLGPRDASVDGSGMTWVARAALAALLACGSGARASSDIVGTAVDVWEEAPLKDVQVWAHSPSQDVSRFARTDAQGRFHFAQLPPGTYSLLFSTEQDRSQHRYWVLRKEDVLLRDGVTLRVDAALVEESGTMICFGGRDRDVNRSRTDWSLTPSYLGGFAVGRSTPVQGAVRSLDGLLALAAGGRTDASGAGISFHGASAFENRHVLEGISTSDPSFGTNALPLSTELLGSFLLTTGGYAPEMGRVSGGLIEATLPTDATPLVDLATLDTVEYDDALEAAKSLHGSVFGSWAPGVLEGPRASDTGTLQHLGDFGATVGGPLIPERLSFFAGVTPALSRVATPRSAQQGEPSRFTDQRSVQALAKLTYSPSLAHVLSLSWVTTPASLRGASPPVGDAWTGSGSDSTTTLMALGYSGYPGPVQVDARVGWLRQQGSDAAFPHERERLQANARTTYRLKALGAHVFRAGADAEFLRDAPLGASATSQQVGVFVQDFWDVRDWFAVNGGVRYDVQWLRDTDGGPALRLGRPFSPRLGVVLDPSGRTFSRFFAHVAKVQGPVLLGLLTPPSSRVSLAPGLVAPSSTEFLAGVELPLMSEDTLGATYTHRRLETGLRSLNRDDGGLVLVNPGTGLGADLPEARRTYEAVMLEWRRTLRFGWQAQVSYTWSRLRGNDAGLMLLSDARGVPRLVTDTEAREPDALLPADRTHILKAFGSREFKHSHRLKSVLGLSYLGGSGTPVDGVAERLPWSHTVNVHVDVRYRVDRVANASFSLDVFNLLNGQAETRLDVAGAPLRYPLPRQVRIGVRYTF
ncbi:TonB-dependent receptor [Corallococcus praedator]|uniref:TonB-dependent receptor n=2 Tax=Myxococcaceae TaxID=31 RepID=A0ABX9QMR6_9BACT|nr:TonB-dependent receptor [Corallococcus sp. CA031C]RKI13940.1 TonB-dependent receptor [Corallococcus praedator]